MKNWLLLVVSIVALFFVSIPALAHHGQGAYNMNKTITVKGTVTEFQLVNPHSMVFLDVKADKGEIQKWQGEMTSPNRLVRSGWNKKTLKPGDEVTLEGFGSLTGSHSLWITKVTLANGEEMKLGPAD